MRTLRDLVVVGMVGTLAFGQGVAHAGQDVSGSKPVQGSTARCRACDQAGSELDDPIGLDKADLSGERVKPLTAPQLPVDEGAKGLEQTLKKLRTRASLMLIVAHPDDEDGGMLAYEARGQGVHAAMLTLTRGEGGQNLMSADFNDGLGLVRTQELLAAGRYMGVDQMFGTQVDFGFSKTKEESFAQWGHDRVLYDAVRAVRLYRPLVIAAVFVGGLTDGHGQHQVSGEIAQEVYDAAGDPKVFPDQIAAGLQPWTPLKVYGRAPFARVSKEGMFDYATGKYEPVRFYNYVTKTWTADAPKPNVTVPEGEASSVLGMTYLQFARQGLALQKTQIGQGVRTAPAGTFDVEYHRYGSRVTVPETESGFFQGIDISLGGIAAMAPEGSTIRGELANRLKAIDNDAVEAAAAYTATTPEKTAPALAQGLGAVTELIKRVEASNLASPAKTDVLHELQVKRVQFNTALVQALGLKIEATAVGSVVGNVGGQGTARAKAAVLLAPSEAPEGVTVAAVPGSWVIAKVKITIGTPGEVYPTGTSVDVLDAGMHVHHWAVSASGKHPDRAPQKEYVETMQVPVPQREAPTKPPFTRNNLEQAYYTVSDPAMRNAPLPEPPLVAWTTMKYEGVTIRLGAAVTTEERGVETPVAVVPAISVAMTPAAGIIPLGEKTLTVTAHIRTNIDNANGTLKLELPAGWKAEPNFAPVHLAKMGDATDVAFTVMPERLVEKKYTITAVASVGGREYREGYRAVGYKGIEAVNLYEPATYKAMATDVRIAPGLKVGYLPGTGDSVADSLKNLGIAVTMLSMDDLSKAKLAGFNAVVLGVRAYAAHPELHGAGGDALNEYAKAGGVVIVQYNTGKFDNGPYPFSLGTEERVVVEADKVTLLKPDAPALAWPNKLAPADFEGWVEEWGHGFMGTWDPHYEALLEVHDPGEEPQKGGLLVAKTGKGEWVYCALALYRQLPEGVPGGYRLLANLVSLGKAPGR